MTWVIHYVSTVSYTTMVNGSPTTPFSTAKGLRQGDPISPYLFAIGMDYFSRLLLQLHNHPQSSYHPRCKKLKLTQLLFADDLLLFCKCDVPSIRLLFSAFNSFSACSGLVANASKSFLYMAGIPDSTK